MENLNNDNPNFTLYLKKNKSQKSKMTIKVFISHMNREDSLTQIAHQFSDYLNADNRISVWVDTEHFGRKQITQKSRIEEIIRSGINKAQIFIAIYFPDKELSRELSEWLINEERKAINASMPVLEIYLHGAKERRQLNNNELNYRKRYTLFFTPNEKWKDKAKENIISIGKKYNLG